MKINIVNYERDFNDGILTKYANKMNEKLLEKGFDSKIDNKPDINCDVNHHINYAPYKYIDGYKGVDTLMVTHFTSDLGTTRQKLDKFKESTKTAIGICFSQSIYDYAANHGIPKNRLAVVLPAHSGYKRRPWVVAILTKAYPDGRKREGMVLELVKSMKDKDKFAFRMMGTGWRDIVNEMGNEGFNQIEYFEDYDEHIHKSILESSDYLLYTGLEDEGAISVLEGANAGLKTIAPLNGFHNEIGIDYPFNTQRELNNIFKKLGENRVEDWTWDKYVDEHIKIWQKEL